MEEYRASILEYDSVKNAIAYSEKRAMEKGVEKGRREGRREGRQEGRQEERREMIKLFLRGGVSIEFISSITGLGVEQIKNISESQESTIK
jgi:predicted transposase/invertase (TIGR01784 family)